MPTDLHPTEDSFTGDGVERTFTQARGGFRGRRMLPVLVISTLLAVAALVGVLLVTVRLVPHSTSTQAVALGSATDPSSARQSAALPGRTWTLAHLGPNALEKCNAFRQVLKRTAQLQIAGGGTISSSERNTLEAELNSAKGMTPTSVTPSQCGLPL